ncbi:NAD(P)-dependent oxidoreductase [Neomegalonema sp.]|uniref:SDR family oxidoreductase n=1 Tax=Neomegalonema sp. TaxID=2039713 RepID=UPI00260F6359|nr:NAD(P)-dependent oxidoreductase [Neomegalonema sp.]MDD2870278.1 NAD(P)-dependent oxidoreductase [Neomegalonema sp.]
MSLKGKRIFITGGSRGIGLAIARRAAAEGARIAIAAKTDRPHPKLEGTIHSAAEEIRAAGGEALPILCDIRDEAATKAAVDEAAAAFGGLDILVNNASAISLTPTLATEPKRFDLMLGVNARGTFMTTQAALPHLLKAENPHVLTLSPPLDLDVSWFRNHAAYSLAKYGMSLLTLGWAGEYQGKVAFNCLWPRTTIDTAAVRNLLGGLEMANQSRKPEILADAAAVVFGKPARSFTGWFLLDDLLLAAEGVTDFEPYAVTPGAPLAPDFFVPHDAPSPEAAQGMIGWRAQGLKPGV